MARVTYVKSAKQRYAMVPVLSRTGEALTIETTRKTKRGNAIIRQHTVVDKTKPLPMPKCDLCNKEIEVGTPYKWIGVRSGPYSGQKRYRHDAHPNWHVWEYSWSLSARLAQIAWEFEQATMDANCSDDITSAGADAASAIREIAEEKRESAENIREGFGHDTYISEELDSTADSLETWADEVENFSVDEPESEEVECDNCDGVGLIVAENVDTEKCEQCGGEGVYTPEDPTDEQVEAWRDDVLSSHVINDSPL